METTAETEELDINAPFEDEAEALAEVKNIHLALESRRTPYDSIRQDIIDYIHPSRGYYAPDGEKTHERNYLYNSRAVLDLVISSSGFLGYTANRRTNWYLLQFDDYQINKAPGMPKYLETCAKIESAWFMRTGFYEALAEMVPDGLGIGTGYTYSEENAGNVGESFFNARHPKAMFIAENSQGEVDTSVEEVWTTYRAAYKQFGNNLYAGDLQRVKDTPYEGKKLYLLVLPRDKRFDKFRRFKQIPIHSDMKYTGVWFDSNQSKILDVCGFWEYPYLVWRCRRVPGAWYGDGPGTDVVSDVLVANQISRSRLQLGNLIADPPMTVSKGLEGQDDLVPGMRAYKQKETDSMEPIQIGANYPITKDNEEMEGQIIDEHFMIPLYRMLQQASGQMTAREVIERLGEKISILGPMVGSFETQVLQKAVRRGFNTLQRARAFPEPPRAFLDAIQSGHSLKIEFVGFFSQAQKKYYQTTNIAAGLEVAGATAQMFPDALHVLKGDEFMREGLEAAGVPSSTIRDDDELKDFRTQLAQAQQAAKEEAMQMAQQENLMKYSGNLGKAPQAGSPLDELNKAMAPQGGV